MLRTTGQVSLLLVLSLLFAGATGAADTEARYDRDAALSLSQAAMGEPFGDYTLRDTNGQPFELGSLRGKPVVVSLIYTSCHHICPLITRNIQETVEIAREALGDDSFSVISVGFDWRVDTPERMGLYARQFRIDDIRA